MSRERLVHHPAAPPWDLPATAESLVELDKIDGDFGDAVVESLFGCQRLAFGVEHGEEIADAAAVALPRHVEGSSILRHRLGQLCAAGLLVAIADQRVVDVVQRLQHSALIQ